MLFFHRHCYMSYEFHFQIHWHWYTFNMQQLYRKHCSYTTGYPLPTLFGEGIRWVSYGNIESIPMGWVQEAGSTGLVSHTSIQGSEEPHHGNGKVAETRRHSER